MTWSPALRQHVRLRTAAVEYVVIASAGTALLVAAIDANVLPSFAVPLWLLYLGPIGVVTDVVLAASGLTAIASGSASLALGAACTIAFTGLALLNVLAVQRLRRADVSDLTDSVRPQRRLLTGVLFAFAGAAFVLLSFLAGFAFLVAYGVDAPTPDPIRIRVQTFAAVGWPIGRVVAIAGLVIWVRGATRQRSTLRFAVADLAVIVTLMAAAAVNSSFGSE